VGPTAFGVDGLAGEGTKFPVLPAIRPREKWDTPPWSDPGFFVLCDTSA